MCPLSPACGERVGVRGNTAWQPCNDQVLHEIEVVLEKILQHID